MAAVVTNQGALLLTQKLLNLSVVSNILLDMFVNDHTPAVLDNWASYVLCSASGYTQVELYGANWVPAVAGGIANFQYPTVTWDFTDNGGGQTVYGYLVHDGADNVLWAERFSVPFAIPSGGAPFNLDLSWMDHVC